MKTTHAALTHTGHHRKNNEDAWLADPAARLYAVCDGMGGHEDGEVASRIAIETLAERLGGAAATDPHDIDAAREALRAAVLEAHERIAAESVKRDLDVPMGTTLVAAILLDEIAVIAATGDSRVYLAGSASAVQITRDHTVAERYADMGLIRPEEVRSHPLRNLLVRALGSPIDAEPDLKLVPMGRGDRLLLCSDGLSDRLRNDEILGTTRREQPVGTIVSELVRRALEEGGYDNITMVMIEREDGDQPQALLDEDSLDAGNDVTGSSSEDRLEWAARPPDDSD